MFKWLLMLSMVLSMELYAEKKVLAFSGSTREQSLNKKFVNQAAEIAKEMGATVTLIDLRDYPMPFYDGDLEDKNGMPEKAKEFRRLMVQSDVIIISAPEYNGSFSGVLKNAIDWASRSETGGGSRDAFKGKKFVLLSVSPGQGGGGRMLPQLKTIIENIGGEVPGPIVTLPNGSNAFDAQGKIVDQAIQSKVKQAVEQTLKS